MQKDYLFYDWISELTTMKQIVLVNSDHDWLLERDFRPWSRKKKFSLWPYNKMVYIDRSLLGQGG